MNPFVLFMSIRSIVRFMFSKDPEIARQRKETEEWAENNIKRPFIEGLEGDGTTEYIKLDIPQGKHCKLYRTIASLLFALPFLGLPISLNLPDDWKGLGLLCLGPIQGIGLLFLYKMWRNRAHRATVKVWKGTKEPVEQWKIARTTSTTWYALGVTLFLFGSLFLYIWHDQLHEPPAYHSVMERVYRR